MKRRAFVAAAVLGGLVLLAACGKDETPRAAASSPPPTPTATASTFAEAEWTIVTPGGWTSEDTTSTVDAKKAIRYSDTTGNYFIVAIDPNGSDFSPDTIWNYAVKGSSFEVVKKTPCTGGAEAQCNTTDQRYDGYLMWTPVKQEAPKVGGHTWYFIFGNTTKTTIDEALFERIAESVTVKT